MIRISWRMKRDSPKVPFWKAGMIGHGWPHPESERARLQAHCDQDNPEMDFWLEDVPEDQVKEQCERFERLKAEQAADAQG